LRGSDGLCSCVMGSVCRAAGFGFAIAPPWTIALKVMFLAAVLVWPASCGSNTATRSGTTPPPSATLTPSATSLNFGQVPVETTSTSQSLTLTNLGSTAITVSAVKANAPFAVSGFSGSATLNAGQSLPLAVTFAPAAQTSYSGRLTITSTAPSSPNTVTLSGSGVTQTSGLPNCGKVNDTNIYVPPNYDTFTPPGKGQSYTDPVFGCTITRITDAIAMGWQQGKHWYSTVTPFNANDTYLMLTPSGSPTIVDSHGNTVVSQANFPAMNYTFAVWDTMNPNVFYYTSGNRFIKGTIAGTPPNATVTPTVLAMFSQYSSVTIPDDEDLSDDGLHIWLSSAAGGGGTGNLFLVTLNAGNGAATSSAQSTTLTNITYHKIQIAPGNRVSVENNGRTMYNPDGTVFQSWTNGDHVDWGLDDSGVMVAASLWFARTNNNGCPSNWGLGLLDLTPNTVRLCLTSSETIVSAWHVSARDINTKHWIIWSADDGGTCPSSSYYCFNNPTNTSGWRLYDGEIVLFTSSGTIVRLAHHRSRTNENYWAQTRAAVSRDGRYVLFESNYNQSGTSAGSQYTDTYIIGQL